MTPDELARTVLRSVRGAVEDRELCVPVPERAVVRPPPAAGRGDYATGIALQLAKSAGRPAREVAEILRERLVRAPGIARVEIAGPGFLNVTLDGGAQVELVRSVLAQGSAYGQGGAYGRSPRSPRPSKPARSSLRPRSSRLPHFSNASLPSDFPVPAVEPRPAAGVRAAVVAEALERILRAVGGRPGAVVGAEAGAAVGVTGSGGALRVEVNPVPVRVGEGELLARIGADEMRWGLLRAAGHDRARLPDRPDQREDNPLFRVRYAYARTRALARNARDLGFAPEPGDPCAAPEPEDPRFAPGPGDPCPVPAPGADPLPAGPPPPFRDLYAAIAGYPGAVRAAARHLAPDRIARHLETTADAFFRCHDAYPPLPVGEQKPSAAHRARVALAEATGTVLFNGLHLLGVSAPEHL